MSIMDVFADLFMGILASSFCILIIYFFRKNFFDMGVLTFKGLTFIYGLIILRALVPLELPFAVSVRCQLLVPVTDFLFFNPIQYKGTEYYGWQIVVSLYLTLVLLFIFRLVFYYVKADRTLKHIPCITDMNTCALLGKVISEAKQTVNVRLLTSSDIYSPISSGIFEPAIVLPANYHEIYSESELYFILKHEYTHVIMDQDYLAVYPDGTCRVFFHNGLVNVVPSEYIDLFKEYNGKIVYEP